MKRSILPALVLAYLSLLLATTGSWCQETASRSETSTAGLPNAPSVTQATTCTEKNGKPCAEWIHKLVGQYPPLPESQGLNIERDPSTVHFWTYRAADEPALRNNKQVFRSKLFMGAHVGGAIAMIVACRNKNSREQWHSEVPAVAALFGVDYLQFRFIGGPNAVGAPIYEMFRYSRAAKR